MLDERRVLADDDILTFAPETLPVPIEFAFDTPVVTPVASIVAPKEHSINCGDLVLNGLSSTGNLGQPMLYRWAFEPYHPLLEPYTIFSEDNNLISISAGFP